MMCRNLDFKNIGYNKEQQTMNPIKMQQMSFCFLEKAVI